MASENKLTVKEIWAVIGKTDDLYKKYSSAYARLKSETFNNCASVRYSTGGTVYPLGKYFFGQSKIYRKGAKQSPGHFCKTLEEADFAYVYSENGQLLAVNKMWEHEVNNEGIVYDTSFSVYRDSETYILKFRENTYNDIPVLGEIGILYNKNGAEVMTYSDAPCTDLNIVVIDKENDNEYLYSMNKEIFLYKNYPPTDELYGDCMVLNK